MSEYLTYLEPSFVESYRNKRANESHIADVIYLAEQSQGLHNNLTNAKQAGVKYVILGIPEDIGPRANCGKGGADKAWRNFLPVFLNQQANEFFDWSSCMILGSVTLDDLIKQSTQACCSDHQLDTLRTLCAKVDKRVVSILTPVFEMGFEVIVIGGGHNNAYPIIHSLYNATSEQISCANLDPHADFRACEGRHSGNPFRYAYNNKMLSHYCVVGLHEQKNNQDTIDGLKQAGFPFYTYQSLFMSQQSTFENMLFDAREYVSETSGPIGVEVDLDCIKQAAASAYSVAGFSLEQAVRYVYRLATLRNSVYVHLCEGAPASNEATDANAYDTGQILTQLVYSYVQARKNKEPELPI